MDQKSVIEKLLMVLILTAVMAGTLSYANLSQRGLFTRNILWGWLIVSSISILWLTVYLWKKITLLEFYLCRFVTFIPLTIIVTMTGLKLISFYSWEYSEPVFWITTVITTGYFFILAIKAGKNNLPDLKNLSEEDRLKTAFGTIPSISIDTQKEMLKKSPPKLRILLNLMPFLPVMVIYIAKYKANLSAFLVTLYTLIIAQALIAASVVQFYKIIKLLREKNAP